ncbi:hypothetical protein GPDM_13491 [Planococcus donghaensis MPA1U2]|uniref:Uncharacterized protein n=1 Tax=Planococcus donghaensis MPA1U2 TaxID=933115 RepID=E7RJM8_9BACL|nr:hypothetical protein [Planococcus donghaensis]EGA88870.1 hypothetical protein GPDM_13491 [Planococcus donghaensis MPA1U2]
MVVIYYFIDHKKKKIHQRQFAGDRCGFVETPVEKREFTDQVEYIQQLETKDLYETCKYCQQAQSISG